MGGRGSLLLGISGGIVSLGCLNPDPTCLSKPKYAPFLTLFGKLQFISALLKDELDFSDFPKTQLQQFQIKTDVT